MPFFVSSSERFFDFTGYSDSFFFHQPPVCLILKRHLPWTSRFLVVYLTLQVFLIFFFFNSHILAKFSLLEFNSWVIDFIIVSFPSRIVWFGLVCTHLFIHICSISSYSNLRITSTFPIHLGSKHLLQVSFILSGNLTILIFSPMCVLTLISGQLSSFSIATCPFLTDSSCPLHLKIMLIILER